MSFHLFPACRNLTLVCLAALTLYSLTPLDAQTTPVPVRREATKSLPPLQTSYGKIPLSFEANQGQSSPQVKFLSHGNGYSLFLTDKDAVLVLAKRDDASPVRGKKPASPAKQTETDVVRMELAGANPALSVSGTEQLAGSANYFIGSDPSKWRSGIPTYARVKYSGVYPGIDLLYYGNQRQLEYDFVVAPGASPEPVHLHFAGASKLKLNADGDLAIIARNGEIAFHKPAIYQIRDGQRQPVEGEFKLLAGNRVGFKIGAYDLTRELVIDPVLAYATYLGGSDNDVAFAIAVDASGHAYIAGRAVSTDFPTTAGAYQTVNTSAGNGIAFVTKLNAAGSALVYSTFLGGSTSEQATGIAIDAEGEAFVLGTTTSHDFPVTSGAFQTTNHVPANTNPAVQTSNVFIARLNSTGSGLVYATYLGGSSFDDSVGIAIDTSGDAFVTGYTADSDFPVTPGAFQPKRRGAKYGENFFVSELASTGSSLVYSTYLGGSSDASCIDRVAAIAVDDLGLAYVTGTACGSDFPTTPGAFQTAPKTANTSSAVIVKLNSTGTALIYSTYLGGSLGSIGSAIAVDAEGQAYVTGDTSGSTDFPTTPGAYEVIPAPYGASFVTKLNATGSGLVYSTYSDGSGSIALDPAGDAYLSGFPALVELNAAGSGLLYSASLNPTEPSGVAVDILGNAYITGLADRGLPTTAGALQTVDPFPADETSFVAKFAFSGGTTTTLTSGDNPQASGENVTFTAHVAPASTSGIPTGTVRFVVDQGDAAEVALDGSGNASFLTDSLAVGAHTIVAIYLGESNMYLPSKSTLAQNIYLSDSGPQAEPSLATIQFGTMPYGATPEILPLTITNTGGGTLTISPVINGPSYIITRNTCAAGVTAGNSCTLQIQYKPVQVGLHNDFLTISNNGHTTPIVKLLGSATGISVVSHQLKFSPTGQNLVFGAISATSTESLPITIIASGVSGTVALNFSINGPSYTIPAATNGCLAGIANGQSCQLTILYKPVGTGLHDDTLTITPSAAAAPSSIGLVGSAN